MTVSPTRVVVDTGVVCVGGRDPDPVGALATAAAYVACGDGRAAWLDGASERNVASEAETRLIVAIGAEEASEKAARSVASAIARVMARLHPTGVPRDPAGVLARYVAQAHTRLYWSTREHQDRFHGASIAAAWIVEDRAAWVQIGAARVWRVRGGVLERLSRPWEAGDRQRLIGGSRDLGDDTAVHISSGRNAGLLQLAPGDRLVLGTSGLTSALDEGPLARVLTGPGGPQDVAVEAVDRARACGGDGAIAVVLADVRASPDLDPDDEPTVEVERP